MGPQERHVPAGYAVPAEFAAAAAHQRSVHRDGPAQGPTLPGRTRGNRQPRGLGRFTAVDYAPARIGPIANEEPRAAKRSVVLRVLRIKNGVHLRGEARPP